MEREGFRLGQLVFSKAGRDVGRPFIVVGVYGDRFVLVADGDARRVASPKKKNVRHLQPTRRVHAALAARLQAGDPVTDAEVQAALRELAETPDGDGDGRGAEGHD